MPVDEQLFNAARDGDAGTLAGLLDAHPEKLHARTQPYEWTLLHLAAHNGHLAVVNLLISRGLDVNTREKGDNTSAMHWAAAAGHLNVVRRLADAGGDVIGEGDEHRLSVIGWATCWNNYHAPVADFLVSRGARHHIFSAVSMNLAEEVRRIVEADPHAVNSRLTSHDSQRTPLHHAVLNNRPQMIALLLDLGADPLAGDGAGVPAAVCATRPDVDRPLMERIRDIAASEAHVEAPEGRRLDGTALELVALLALRDWDAAARFLADHADSIDPAVVSGGALHLMAKRGDTAAVKWLLDRGADPNARLNHWDAEVTPLHLAAAQGHADVVRLLVASGGDPEIRDSKHDGNAIGWAEYGRTPQAPNWQEIVAILEGHSRHA